ncbi:hypothetical protein HOK51_03420 [Candidatus Woesearchaeota archaeon]|jgi:calcineurin-like phosphoesterase family protein|nr:hypothetical protein [Candidatus Woesearchaeota archaeon]MBT6518870.1 hypothetical protein [Candidatus Woesearchaeota archaeon]MBT7368009.1 hypothetical protein [Candidatus Woesearchaeota archaeon]
MKIIEWIKQVIGIQIKTRPTPKFKSKQIKVHKPKIFLAADLHIDHKNIIKYCHRPFRSVQQMNNRLVSNWNRTVRKNDVVYFLGDLAYGRSSRSTDYWYRKLNGRKIFIKGNHDRSRRIKMHKKKVLKYKGFNFLLVHSPQQAKYWKGWVIHGHKHNNNKRYPLINKRSKLINVSCELTKYRPINIDVLMRKIR